MPIYNFETGREVEGVLQHGERGKAYKLIMARLSKADLDNIRSALDAQISGDEIPTSSWIPGADWNGTAYFPLWEVAAKKNYTLAALMFGLMVWEAFERHPDKWYTGKFEKDGEEISGRTYFKPQY